MTGNLLPEYIAFAQKPTRAYLLLAAVAAALPVLGLCYLSGLVWSRHIITNAADVVLAQRLSFGKSAFGAVSLAASSSDRSCPPVKKLIPPPKTRQDIAIMLEHEGFEVGAELGVQHGVFAAETLWVWRSCKRYYLIDSYGQQPDPQHHYASLIRSHTHKQQVSGQLQTQQQEQQQQAESMQQAHENLQGWQHKLVWMRNSTTVAATLIREPLDYVYVDARRDYCGVLEDLETWWPLLKPGGIMAGHSYENAVDVLRQGGEDWSRCADGQTVHQGAVQAAVNDFFIQQGLQLVVTYRERAWNSWLVRKPYYPCRDHLAAGTMGRDLADSSIQQHQDESLTQLLSKMLQQSPQQQQQQLDRQDPQSLQASELQQQQEEQVQQQEQQVQESAESQELLLHSTPQDVHAAAAEEQQQQQQQAAAEEEQQQQHRQHQLEAALLKLHDPHSLAESRAQQEVHDEQLLASQERDAAEDIFGDILNGPQQQ